MRGRIIIHDMPQPSPPPQPAASAFDAYYYRNCCGQPYERNETWLTFFGGIADRIVRDIAPRTALDAGCAMGLLVETLRARGVDATGVDISTYAIERAHESVRPYCRVGSIAEPFDRRVDLIVCIEVVEHMPADEAERAIANLCRHTDDVLFSSTPFDFREPTHVNVHTPEYWGEQFARHGFFRDVDFDAGFITRWAVRYRRRTEPLARIVRDYERRFWELRLAESDARAYSMDVQKRLETVEAERDRIARVELLELREETSHLRNQLARALDTIRHMERSAFWRARLASLRVRRLFSRNRAAPPGQG